MAARRDPFGPTPHAPAGSVWADNDPRAVGRTLRVERIEWSSRMGCEVAVCTVLTNRDGWQEGGGSNRVGAVTRIAVRRFRPTASGYRLIFVPAIGKVTVEPSGEYL